MRIEKTIEDLGKLSLTDRVIQYQSQFYQPWKLSVDDLQLLGEYTNEDGPHAADHFVVFIGTGDRIFEAPVDANGTDLVLMELEKTISSKIKLEFFFTTRFISQVIWPEQLKGKPLFVICEQIERCKFSSGTWTGRVGFNLAPEIILYINGLLGK